MKVLQINTVCGIGSTGRIVTDLAKAIIGNGDECYVAYGQKATSYERSFKIGSKLENHLHNIGSRLFDKQGFYTVAGTRKLISYIESINPDVIHLHNLHGNFVNIQILFEFLEIADIPVVWTMHDCWAFTGHCAYFDFIDCPKWRTQCNNCPNKHSYPTSYFIDSSETNFTRKKDLFNKVKNMTIVTPSNWLAELIKQSFLSKYEVQVINNGIDTDIFNIRNTNQLRDKLKITNQIILLGVSAEGFTGRKGLTYFIKLAADLPSTYKIVLLGASKSDKSQLPDNVISIARTENIMQLAEYYSLADVFINPTLEDNFPTTNLEALACGTPIVTFQTGGSPESIDKKTGIVVAKNDYNNLLKAILSANTQLKKENYLTCRNKAVEYFDKTTMYQKYLQLYKEISIS